jgi:hypothetical protein
MVKSIRGLAFVNRHDGYLVCKNQSFKIYGVYALLGQYISFYGKFVCNIFFIDLECIQ